MAQVIRLPLMGQTMEEGTILRWMKEEGDSVEQGEPLVEIMTDKVNQEMESPESGVLLKRLHPVDAVIPVKAPLCILGEAGEEIAALLTELGIGDAEISAASTHAAEAPFTLSSESADSPETTLFHADRHESPEGSQAPLLSSPRARRAAAEHQVDLSLLAGRGAGPHGRIEEADVLAYIEEMKVRITPLAQKMAHDAGIEPRELVGSGPGGKIRSDDVKKATEPSGELPLLSPESLIPKLPAPETSPEVAPPGRESRRVPLTPLRRLIAENVARSARTAPHVTLTMETDVTELARLRTALMPDAEKRHGVRLTYTDLIVKATALALRDHPWLNSSFDENAVLLHGAVHIGIAVALPEGLIVPVLRDADLKALPVISREVKDLATRARSNQLKSDELSGGTFTVTNLGGYGVDTFTPILNPPQCGILGVGRMVERPAFGANGAVEARRFMNLCLTFDHRVVDGAPAAEFLRDIKELLENPYRILL